MPLPQLTLAPGSNDRNCERNANRNNGNRLFDSQNNAAGGYACPRAVGDETFQDEDGVAKFGGRGTPQDKKMYYYEGSILPIEWTNQHGCGPNSKVNCEIIIQYMCEDTADPEVNNFWPWSNNKWGPSTDNAVTGEKKVGEQAFRSTIDIASPRDGIPRDSQDAATDTIPKNAEAAVPNTKENRRFGMHENFDYYDRCEHTERNKGLYTADQRMRRNDQRATRQNPNGNRNGLECPEERDHYPWWHPTPWIDVAVLTNEAPSKYPCTDITPIVVGGQETGRYVCKASDKAVADGAEESEYVSARCAYYLANSMNKHKKGYCDAKRNLSVQVKYDSNEWKQNRWPNNKEACEAVKNGAGEEIAEWIEISHADNFQTNEIGYPICGQTSFSRVNHLGNADDDANVDSSNYFKEDNTVYLPQSNNANRFVWTIPSIPEPKNEAAYFSAGMEKAYQSCTLRLRYNISTSDFAQWPEDAMEIGHPWAKQMVNATHNAKKGQDDSRTPLVQDPYIYTGAGDAASKGSQFVSLAANTNQYGRTFQDRSYKFAIKKRPTATVDANDVADEPRRENIPANAKIFNVNVRGKRGNIVQTYPSVEYDFVPNRLAVDKDSDYIHFQWTGSDYNPRRGCNNGEGGPPDPNDFVSAANANKNSRADRSNLIFMNTMAENVPMDMLGITSKADENGLSFQDRVLKSKDALKGETPCGDSNECYEHVMRLAYLNQQSDGGSLMLRGNKNCLTEEELDAIKNKNERENHPLNCAKLNAKPFPYFDGGVMKAQKGGKFAYFSSRNNNFSNRDQTGILCVRGDGETCVNDASGVLQDENQHISTATIRSKSYCNDEASDYSMGNNFGSASCIELDETLLLTETQASTQADNDKIGDGNEEPCDTIIFFFQQATLEEKIGLAIALLFVGMGSAWGGYYAYNRYQANANKGKRFAGNKNWKGAKATEMI